MKRRRVDPDFVYNEQNTCESQNMQSPTSKTVQRQLMMKNPEKLYYDESWQTDGNGRSFRGYCNAKFYSTRLEQWKEKCLHYHNKLYGPVALNEIEGGHQLKIEEKFSEEHDEDEDSTKTYVMLSFYNKKSIVIINGCGFLKWIQKDYPKLLTFINTGHLEKSEQSLDMGAQYPDPHTVTEVPQQEFHNLMLSHEDESLRTADTSLDSDFEDIDLAETEIKEVLMVHNSPHVAVSKLKNIRTLKLEVSKLKSQNENLEMKIRELGSKIEENDTEKTLQKAKYDEIVKDQHNKIYKIQELIEENNNLKNELSICNEEKQVLEAKLHSLSPDISVTETTEAPQAKMSVFPETEGKATCTNLPCTNKFALLDAEDDDEVNELIDDNIHVSQTTPKPSCGMNQSDHATSS